MIRNGDKIFATARGYGEYKGWWEFPGGKIEDGETPQQALIREIREELTAEMGAAFLCSQVGIDCAKAFKNSAAYIKGWLNHLRGDNKAIVIAAGKAERAAKYILTGEK